MSDERAILDRMKISSADHLPLVAAFLDRIGVEKVVNAAVASEMAVDPGTMVKLMVLDTLSGRSPLYRLEEFASSIDTHLLLGRELEPSAFAGTTMGRALDAIYASGTEQLFSQVALAACRAFPAGVDPRHVHFDTTSVSVWGDYTRAEEDAGVNVTYGYFKDHRPDLKQFLVQMLCVHRNIPVLGGLADGNASDKTINNRLLTNLARYMSKHGIREGAFVYVADSAMVTPANLAAIGGNLFITRLPATYAETARVISQAVEAGDWAPVEAKAPSYGKRKAASYRVAEAGVTICEQGYRAVVVHSDSGDKRRQQSLDRALDESREAAAEVLRSAAGIEYFCRADAEAAAARLAREATPYHFCSCTVEEKPVYAVGRPPKSGERKVTRIAYVLAGEVAERPDAVERARAAAGCFVLLTNVPTSGEMAHTAAEVLAAYKEQHGIEHDLFLKRPDRIEALGFILLTSLLTWSLMEHVMRAYLEENDTDIIGWDKKKTRKPTTFMMTTKFKGMHVVRIGEEWFLAAPFTKAQQQFVQALGLSEELILRRGVPPHPAGRKLPGKSA